MAKERPALALVQRDPVHPIPLKSHYGRGHAPPFLTETGNWVLPGPDNADILRPCPEVDMQKRAVVLLSGGLDSATCLAMAIDQGFDPVAVSYNYDQRHRVELEAAMAIAHHYRLEDHLIFDVGMFRQIGGSALTDSIDVPKSRNLDEMTSHIPVTYVPARNTVFLSYALGVAEVTHASDLFIGVNALDYSGYPDCRPEYVEAFERMANLAVKPAVEGQRIRVRAPLIHKTKAEIVAIGRSLGVPFHLTHSCYAPTTDGAACGTCDACILRRDGFEGAGVPDPTVYVSVA